MTSNSPVVLVTGASSFIGIHIIRLLLKDGFRVRGTVRDPTSKRAAAVRECVADLGGHLELVQGDLTVESVWGDVVKGCTYVLHVASPVDSLQFHLDDMQRYLRTDEISKKAHESALNGTIFVLEAAKKAGVKRVVLTASVASMFPPGWAESAFPTPDVPGAWDGTREWEKFTVDHTTWTDESLVSGYSLAKTRAEKAAWECVKDSALELSVINPGPVFGPPLHKLFVSDSLTFIELSLRQPPDSVKSIAALAPIYWPTVDVRDVALVHVRAMLLPQAAGKRYPTGPHMKSLSDIGRVLAKKFQPMGYDCVTTEAPYAIVRLMGIFDPMYFRMSRVYGRYFNFDCSRTKSDLQIEQWRPFEQSLLDTVYACVALGRFEKRPGFVCNNPEFHSALAAVPFLEAKASTRALKFLVAAVMIALVAFSVRRNKAVRL